MAKVYLVRVTDSGKAMREIKVDVSRGEPVRITANPGDQIQLFDSETGKSPKKVIGFRAGDDLYLEFHDEEGDPQLVGGTEIPSPDVIIEKYYAGETEPLTGETAGDRSREYIAEVNEEGRGTGDDDDEAGIEITTAQLLPEYNVELFYLPEEQPGMLLPLLGAGLLLAAAGGGGGGDSNDAPVAVNDAATTNEDTPVSGNVLANDTDDDGDTLTVATYTQPANGSVVVNPDGSFTYTPDANFNGTDSFTYVATDGEENSNTATVTITVNPADDQPTLADPADGSISEVRLSSATTSSGLSGTLSGTDVDVETLTYGIQGGTESGGVWSQAGTYGTLTVNQASGAYAYTPSVGSIEALDDGEVRSDVFTVTVSDGDDGVVTQTYAVTVTGANDYPVANNDSYSTTEDTPLTVNTLTGVLANDTDVDIEPLTAVLVTGPANGSLTLNPDGSFTYTPNSNFYGTDTFTYVANDGTEDSNTATVTINVTSDNQMPMIISDGGGATGSLNMIENQTSVRMFGLDGASPNLQDTVTATDADGDTLTYSIVGGVDASKFVIDPTTGALYLYGDDLHTVAPDYENPTDVGANNVYDVIVRVEDGRGGSDEQAIAVAITNAYDVGLDLTRNSLNFGAQDQVVIQSHSANAVLYYLKDPQYADTIIQDPNISPKLTIAGDSSGLDGSRVLFTDGSMLLTAGKTSTGVTWTGGLGDDQLVGGRGNDVLDGGPGTDVLRGSVIDGTGISGNDTLTGGEGMDLFQYIQANEGNDTITDFTDNEDKIEIPTGYGTPTATQVGEDTVITFSGSSTTITLLGVDADTITADDFVNYHLYGSIYSDDGSSGSNDLDGTAGKDLMLGNEGNDDIYGYGGNDIINGGAGNDRITTGTGSDVVLYDLTNEGNDTVTDFTDNQDKINVPVSYGTFTATQSGANTVVTFTGSPTTITLTGFTATNLTGADFIYHDYGTAQDDVLNGTVYADQLEGYSGNDTLTGSEGNDVIGGGSGYDILNGGLGSDTLTGGTEGDLFVYGSGNEGLDTITDFSDHADLIEIPGSVTYGVSGATDAVITLSSGTTITLLGIPAVNISGDDFVNGHFYGDGGDDVLTGTDARELLRGLGGDDTLDGGAGNDILEGGLGDDELTGGGGADIFSYSLPDEGHDTITDFSDGSDLIEIPASYGTPTITDSGADTVITFAGSPTQITLTGVDHTLITTDDFRIV